MTTWRNWADIQDLFQGPADPGWAYDQHHPNAEHGDAFARHHQILRTVVGSGVHGIAIEGTDDHDEMGVYIEPPEYVMGIQRSKGTYVWRTQPEGERSGPGDTDLVLHSLRKYLRLAAKGNPTALLPLWAPPQSVLYLTEQGRQLRAIRDAFMSLQAVGRFLGYMNSQHQRMLGCGKRNRVPNRPELVRKHGYDTKFAAHALRLAYEGYEIALTGRLTLPMAEDPRNAVLEVKEGKWAMAEVSAKIANLVTTIETALRDDGTPLPREPDWNRINDFAIKAHQAWWHNYDGT